MPALELATELQHRRATQREHTNAEDTRHVLGDGRDLSRLEDVVEKEEVHGKEAHDQPRSSARLIRRSSSARLRSVDLRAARCGRKSRFGLGLRVFRYDSWASRWSRGCLTLLVSDTSPSAAAGGGAAVGSASVPHA